MDSESKSESDSHAGRRYSVYHPQPGVPSSFTGHVLLESPPNLTLQAQTGEFDHHPPRQSTYHPSSVASDTLKSDVLSSISPQAIAQTAHRRSSLSEKKHPDNSHAKKKVLGNYTLGRTIGEGSFARVKMGFHRLTNQQVAIKIIEKSKLPDEYSMRNIYRETDIMKILNHPNIIQMFEVIETKKEYCIVLEHAAGGEVLDYIVARGRLKESEAKKFIRQIVFALEYMHNHGVVHRDLKSENFLLDADGNIKLSDFGLSNKFDKAKTLATCCGSPVYSAPELIEGKAYVGPEVDMWSLGINIYAMVVGDLPFANSNIAALYDAILKGKYEVPSFVSSECKDLISKLLVLNPKKRFTITQTKEHPWLASSTTILQESLLQTVQSYPKSEKELDHEVLDQMEQMGMDRIKTIESVLRMKYDQLGGTYNLLRTQKNLKLTLPTRILKGSSESPVEEQTSKEQHKPHTVRRSHSTSSDSDEPPVSTISRRNSQKFREKDKTDIARKANIMEEDEQTEENNYDNFVRVMLMVSKGLENESKEEADKGKKETKHRDVKSRASEVTMERKDKHRNSVTAEPTSERRRASTLSHPIPNSLLVEQSFSSHSKKEEDVAHKTKSNRPTTQDKSDALYPSIHSTQHKITVEKKKHESPFLPTIHASSDTNTGLKSVLADISLSKSTEHSDHEHTPTILKKKSALESPVHSGVSYSSAVSADSGSLASHTKKQTPFAYNCQATSTLPPDQISERLRKCLERHGISYVIQSQLFDCLTSDIKFEIEICKLPKNNLYGLKFKRITGEMWAYKDLSTKLIADLHI